MIDTSIFYSDFFDHRWTTAGDPRTVTWSTVNGVLVLPFGDRVTTAAPVGSLELDIFQSAFDLWDEALRSVDFVYDADAGNDADVTLAITPLDGSGGNWGFWNAVWGDDLVTDRATIRFDVEDARNGWLLTTALHEVGNILGLGDIRPSGGLMSVQEDPFPQRFNRDTLWQDDVDLIRGLYGEGAFVSGTPGDDLLSGTAGADTLDGGAGQDTADYADASRDSLDLVLVPDAPEGGEVVRLTDRASGTVDRLVNVERLELADGTLLYDLSAEAVADVYRLYAASLGRTPDEPGLRFWTGPAFADTQLDRLALSFVESAEFRALFGEDPTDLAYIDALYTTVLGRPADPDGRAFWTDAFASGTLDRADMLVAFSESPENVDRTEPDLTDGVWVV